MGGYKKMAAMHVYHAAGASTAKMAPFGAETAAPSPHEGGIKIHHTVIKNMVDRRSGAVMCPKHDSIKFHSTQPFTQTELTQSAANPPSCSPQHAI